MLKVQNSDLKLEIYLKDYLCIYLAKVYNDGILVLILHEISTIFHTLYKNKYNYIPHNIILRNLNIV